MQASMTLAGFTAATFTETHQTAYTKALAASLGVAPPKVILTVANAQRMRRALSTGGVKVVYQVIGLTPEQASAARAQHTAIKANATMFTNALKQEFQEAALPVVNIAITDVGQSAVTIITMAPTAAPTVRVAQDYYQNDDKPVYAELDASAVEEGAAAYYEAPPTQQPTVFREISDGEDHWDHEEAPAVAYVVPEILDDAEVADVAAEFAANPDTEYASAEDAALAAEMQAMLEEEARMEEEEEQARLEAEQAALDDLANDDADDGPPFCLTMEGCPSNTVLSTTAPTEDW
jgi:hypothetical protein